MIDVEEIQGELSDAITNARSILEELAPDTDLNELARIFAKVLLEALENAESCETERDLLANVRVAREALATLVMTIQPRRDAAAREVRSG